MFVPVITNAYTAYTLLTQTKRSSNDEFVTHNNFLRHTAKPSIKGIGSLVDAVHLLNEDMHQLRRDLVSECDIQYALILNLNSVYSMGMHIQALIDHALTGNKVDTKSLCQLMGMNDKGVQFHCYECRKRISDLDRRDTVYKSVKLSDMEEETEWAQHISGQGTYSKVTWFPFYFETTLVGIEKDPTSNI